MKAKRVTYVRRQRSLRNVVPRLVWQSYFISFLHHFISIRLRFRLHAGGWKEGEKSLSEKMTGDKKGRDSKDYPWLPGWALPWERGKLGHEESWKWKERRGWDPDKNVGMQLKASLSDKRKKCFRFLLIFINNWMMSRFLSVRCYAAPDKWASLRPHIRSSQLHFVFMTFSPCFVKAVTRFPTGNNKCYYLPSSPTHIITPASSRRLYLYSSCSFECYRKTLSLITSWNVIRGHR